ncbi:MAG: thioredoxin [Oscillospiraceae bacterium]
MALKINTSNFESEVLESQQPVLVDFWAEWCGPCRMLAPTVDQLAEEYAGRVKVCKLNVDEAPSLAAQYGVTSIPTLILFRDGKPAATSIGVKPKAQLKAMLG